ncbi:MAG: purine-nucleoside phosphorylase [Desulfomonilaceae bacterium]|nr:purine-nucleoside phosphorylase [Desulfomonilaceae bacterium]
MEHVYESVQEAAAFLQGKVGAKPWAAIVLGTGLGGVGERIAVTHEVPYEAIPHFPAATVESHRGRLIFGTLSGRRVVAMQGRIHLYEGYSPHQVTLPVRIMRALGAELLLINSAAGGLNPHFRAGDIMIVTDHINLIGDNPLRGLSDERLGERFPDMSKPYDPELIRMVEEAAADLRIAIRHGVYVAVAGPSLETPAETRMLRMLGADAVGMSTVPEVITARQVGFRTMALAAVTNVNLPDRMEPISVEQVIANAKLAEPRLSALVEAALARAVR